MKLTLLCLMLILLGACKSRPEPTPEYSKSQKRNMEIRIDEIMERMDWPEFALVKMSQNKMYDHPDFKKYTDELIKQNDRLVKIEHWEKSFNRLSKRMASDLDELKAAVESKDQLLINQKWKQAKVTCKKCHDIFE
ncbi:MAG: cytochrome c [Lentisphaeraceae bacterium]|nr:cytochrome c [Lentisphaeraceae bacterium]